MAKSRGLGDTVSKVIKTVTGGKVKECGGCAARKAWLNRKLPYDTNRILYALSQLKRKG